MVPAKLGLSGWRAGERAVHERGNLPHHDVSSSGPGTLAAWPAPSGAAISARSFAGRSDQVAAARSFVRQSLGSLPVPDEAVLLTSELCTNALQHTSSGSGGTFTLTVVREVGRARIEVRDGGSPRDPVTQPPDADSEGGRGLELVEVLADHWGYRGNQNGRTVYFEVTWPGSA
jgi:anti-sigma regulatory factor (Ser/Thr protein kinase)